MGFLVFFFMSFVSFSQDLTGYLIDQVSGVYEPTCDNCPSSVGTMFSAEPLLFSEVQTAEQIRYSNCHVTLVGPKTVITAAHCVRPWFNGAWQEQAQNDCSKSFAFYFPATQGFKNESVSCESIRPVEGNYHGTGQLFPDTVEITLDRDLDRDFVDLNTQDFELNDTQDLTLWINVPNKPRELVEVKCQKVYDTAFTPAESWAKGAFYTLTCDHDVLPGTSGAGVFFGDSLIANISHGAGDHYLSPSLFGFNEVVVSKISCFESQNPDCFMTYSESMSYLKEYHFKAFDLAYEWHPVVLESMYEHFDHAQFSYQKLSTPEIIQNRGFYVSCIKREAEITDELILGFKIDQEKLDVNYVRYDDVGQIIGVHYTLSGPNRPFHNTVHLVKTDDFDFKQDHVEFSTEELSINQVPYCNSLIEY